MIQNKFAFFANFAESIRATIPVEKQPEAYQAICEFGIYGTLPDDPMLKMMCLMAKTQMEESTWGGARKGSGRKSSFQDELEKLEKLEKNQDNLKNLKKLEKEKEKNPLNNPQENKNKNILNIPHTSNDVLPLKEKKLTFDDVVDWESLFDYWEQNKKGGKYKNAESRNRQLAKLKELTNSDFEYAKQAIVFCIDNKYQGFTDGSKLYYRNVAAATASRKTADDDAEWWAQLEKRVAENDYE